MLSRHQRVSGAASTHLRSDLLTGMFRSDPTPICSEEQDANSDNEYVGMFDEEEEVAEEHEEEVDQLSVVSTSP